MTIVALRSNVCPLLAVAQAVDAEPAEHKCERKRIPPQSATMNPMLSQAGSPICDGSLSQLLQLVEPLPGEPEQDQAGQTDEQKREVPEAKQPGVAASQEERGGARQQGAEDDGRADEVEQEREALVAGSDRGEHLRHPASRSCRRRSGRSPPTRGREA